MLSATLKPSRAEYATPSRPAPIRAVTGAFRRVWVRVKRLRHSESTGQALAVPTAEAGPENPFRSVTHAGGMPRIFRAPGLVYQPPAPSSGSGRGPAPSQAGLLKVEAGHPRLRPR